MSNQIQATLTRPISDGMSSNQLTPKKTIPHLSYTILLLCCLIVVAVISPTDSEQNIDTIFNLTEQPFPNMANSTAIFTPLRVSIKPINSTSLIVLAEQEYFAPVQEVQDLFKDRPAILMIQITYWLDRRSIVYSTEKNTNCSSRQMEEIPLDIETNFCKIQVGMFGNYNDTIKQDFSSPNYCEPRKIHLNLPRNPINVSHIITDLLPGQGYTFSYQYFVITETVVANVSAEIMFAHECLMDSAPRYPPQTDIGSFKILPDGAFGARKLQLFWRPVPRLLAGSLGVTHELKCTSKEKLNLIHSENMGMNVGLKEVTGIQPNTSYLCALISKNSHGKSLGSPIIIPDASDILPLESDISLYVIAVSATEYILRWNSVDSLLSNRVAEEMGRDAIGKGKYTIYWCEVNDIKDGCMKIDGMIKTNDTKMDLQFPESAYPPLSRIFGVSYRTANNTKFTGISWASCVSTIHPQAESPHGPLELAKLENKAENHTSVGISWRVKGCKSVISIIDYYEINYCPYGDVDPCRALGIPRVPESSFDFSQDGCEIIRFANNLKTETILNNLKPSSVYVIRMRSLFAMIETPKERALWSRPMFIHTTLEPSKSIECTSHSVSSYVIMFLLALMIPIIYFPFRMVTNHYRSLIVKYRQTSADMPQKIAETLGKTDNPNERCIDLKYWNNKFPPPGSPGSDNSESSLNYYEPEMTGEKSKHSKLNHYEGFPHERQSLYIPDYVPSQLLASLGDNMTPDDLTSSMRESDNATLSDDAEDDEVSMTSHSSFLENILHGDDSTSRLTIDHNLV